MKYRARVTVSLQEGVTDPEGNATLNSLRNLGYSVTYVKKSFSFEIGGEAESKKRAESKVDEMCRKLLANPVKDEYHIEIEEL